MRILFISHDATRTGAPLALLQLLNTLSSKSNDLHMEVLLLRGGELEDSFKKICTVHIKPTYSRKNHLLYKIRNRDFTKSYLYLFKRGQFDCIYANTVVTFNVAVELKKHLQIPLIGHVHEAECAMHRFNMTKELLSEFTRLIAVSELTARNLVNIYNIDIDRIIIQHPISPWVEKYIKDEDNTITTKKDAGHIIIGTFCNGGWWKSMDVLPLLIKLLYKRHSVNNCIFYIVGHLDRESQYQLEYDLKRMGIIDHVKFTGHVSNPLELHSLFDMFLLLSREESFSLTAQEAGIMKKPTIGFDGATGAAEWVKYGAGILVPYMDLESMSDAIYKLATNEDLRLRMGEKAFEITRNIYFEESSLAKTIETIRKVCNFPN